MNQSSKKNVSLPQISFRGETPTKPRKKEMRCNSRGTTEVGQVGGEVKVVHVLNSPHESRDLVLIPVD